MNGGNIFKQNNISNTHTHFTRTFLINFVSEMEDYK